MKKGRMDKMSYVFRQSNENEVLVLTKMSEAAFKTDKEFSGSDGGPTGFASILPNGILEQIISIRSVDIQQLGKNRHRILIW